MISLSTRTLAVRGILSGIVAATVVAVADMLWNLPGSSPADLVARLGILLPAGGIIGLLPVTFWVIIIGPNSTHPPDIWRTADAPALSVRILMLGLTAIVGSKLLYTACHFFAVGFHHPGLAALALVFFLLAAAAVGALALPFVVRIMEHAVVRFRAPSKILGRPIVAVCFALGAAAGIVLPPLRIGPNARGPFGFIGQSAPDAATAALLLVLLGMTVFLTARFRRVSLRYLAPICAAALLLTAVSPLAARHALHESPRLRAAVETGVGPTAWALRFARRARHTR